MSLSILIPQFEGPLGLLLYLIRKEEMDIFDIDVQLITSQYLDYIKKMKQFDLEVAGDFIAMAATLIQIKSKMLLPNYNEEGEDEESLDPRKELVQRLLEYQRYQEASKQLYDRPLLGRDIFNRGKSEAIHSDEEGEIILDEGGLFALIAHYRNSVRKVKKAIHKVASKTRSIAGRIIELKDRFVVGQRVVLRDLVTSIEETKQELLITFLSCLELGKMGYVTVYQAEVYGDIYLTAKKEISRDIVGRVEEYDSHGSEDLANHLIDDAVQEQMDIEDAQLDLSASSEESNTEFVAEAEEADVASDEEIEEAEQELSIEVTSADETQALEMDASGDVDNMQGVGDHELRAEVLSTLASVDNDQVIEAEVNIDEHQANDVSLNDAEDIVGEVINAEEALEVSENLNPSLGFVDELVSTSTDVTEDDVKPELIENSANDAFVLTSVGTEMDFESNAISIDEIRTVESTDTIEDENVDASVIEVGENEPNRDGELS